MSAGERQESFSGEGGAMLSACRVSPLREHNGRFVSRVVIQNCCRRAVRFLSLEQAGQPMSPPAKAVRLLLASGRGKLRLTQ